MTSAEFQEAAVRSAQTYYDFLDTRGRGISAISIKQMEIKRDLVLLTLKTRLPAAAAGDLDGLLFRFDGKDYASHEISPVEYNSTNCTLLVRPAKSLLPSFFRLNPEDLIVFSDLKFLIKRVENWYREHGRSIAHPSSFFVPPIHTFSYVSNPSQEQITAIHGALTTPFSYIWGAPGTGKTRVVLASCNLTLLNEHQKVLLLAPTNNALEQAMSGILPALKEAGISLESTCLRLGTPSSQFADQFPEVCESAGFERRIQQLSSEAEQLKSWVKHRASCSRLSSAEQTILPLLDALHSCFEQYSKIEMKVSVLQRQSVHSREKEILLQRQGERLISEWQGCKKALTSPGAAFEKYLFPSRFSRKQAAEQLAAQLMEENSASIAKNAKVLDNYERERSACGTELSEISERMDALKEKILAASDFLPRLKEISEQLFSAPLSDCVVRFSSAFEEERQILENQAPPYSAYAHMDNDALTSLLSQLSEKLDNLRSLSSEERLKFVSLVGATIDKFLTLDFDKDAFYPNHIFLDEAGYCAFIKGAPLLSLGIPVTFLGDHMQLPPICEMDDDQFSTFENEDVCLWAQSTVHIERLFTDTSSQICTAYLRGDFPPFSDLRKYDLTCTFRFGRALADILAGTVYSENFYSAEGAETEILVLDAPRHPEAVRRTSSSEIQAIARYLSRARPGDFAILTPYRKQVSALSSGFPGIAKDDRILTVHASQGREWNTLLFSVVDTTDKWFVNSRNSKSKGLQVINTAVSRAKKRLVLVCDYDYWATQSNQLIGRLVRSGTLIQ